MKPNQTSHRSSAIPSQEPWQLRPFGPKGPEDRYLSHAAHGAIASAKDDVKHAFVQMLGIDTRRDDVKLTEVGEAPLVRRLRETLQELKTEERPKNQNDLRKIAQQCLKDMVAEFNAEEPISEIRDRGPNSSRDRSSRPLHHKPPSVRGVRSSAA